MCSPPSAKTLNLCTTLNKLQLNHSRAAAFLQAISRDVGPRQLTVRQMLHSAALRSRQPAITAAAADQLVRLSLTGIGSAVEQDGSGSEGTVQGMSPKAAAAAAAAAALLQASSPRYHNSTAVRDIEQGVALESVGSTNLPAARAAPAGPVVPAGRAYISSEAAPGEGAVPTAPRVESPFKAAAERLPSNG
jgi:hypothetical protein